MKLKEMEKNMESDQAQNNYNQFGNRPNQFQNKLDPSMGFRYNMHQQPQNYPP